MRPAHQVQDHGHRARRGTSRARRRNTSPMRSRSGRRGARSRSIPGQGRRGARGAGDLRRGGRPLLPGREALRGLPADQVPGGPRLPGAQPVRHAQKQAAAKKKTRRVGKKLTALPRERSRKQLDGPRRQYLDVFGAEPGALDHRLLGAHRARSTGDFVDQLYTAEIPKDLKDRTSGATEREIFCDELVDKAEPIEAKAVDGFEICLKAATEQSWFNEWSRLCEREMNQMKPSEYPLAVGGASPRRVMSRPYMSADAGRSPSCPSRRRRRRSASLAWQ